MQQRNRPRKSLNLPYDEGAAPSVKAVQSVLEEIVGRNPKAKEQGPRKFFDGSFVRQLETGGFIDSPYR